MDFTPEYVYSLYNALLVDDCYLIGAICDKYELRSENFGELLYLHRIHVFVAFAVNLLQSCLMVMLEQL